jgi:CHAD domain-containing protein
MAKARKIPHLNPEKDLRTCLKKILTIRFEEMIQFEAGTVEGSDVEQLHDMRVASRRIQAVMKVFRLAFPKKEFKQQYKVIRGLKDALGVVRHYDVFINALEKHREKLQGAKALDLLIIRQKALREAKRKDLARYLRELNRRRYKESFLEFAGS